MFDVSQDEEKLRQRMRAPTQASGPPPSLHQPPRGDAEFLRMMRETSLPFAEWTHLAHVRFAWLSFMEQLSEAGLADGKHDASADEAVAQRAALLDSPVIL